MAADAIEKDQRTEADNLMRQVEGRGSQIDERNFVAEIILRFELMKDIGADAVVSQQHIPDSANEY
jgi:hypothetical protein